MYNRKVRIGNWYEDTQLAMYKKKEFCKRKCRKELSIQHTQKLICNLFREITLICNDEFIKFGNYVQLEIPSLSEKQQFKDDDAQKIVLTGTLTEILLERELNLVNDCIVVCSISQVPCTRNCFLLVPTTKNVNVQYLTYEQSFFLKIPNANMPLYVRLEPPQIGPDLSKNIIKLNNIKDCYAKWRVIHQNIKNRIEWESTPLKASTKVLVQHVMTGKYLTVESTTWKTTIFSREYKVTASSSPSKNLNNFLWEFITNCK